MNRQKKASLETLYSRLGMTLPEAVNIFFENSLLVGGCLKSWMKNNAYSQNNFQIQKRLNKKRCRDKISLIPASVFVIIFNFSYAVLSV